MFKLEGDVIASSIVVRMCKICEVKRRGPIVLLVQVITYLYSFVIGKLVTRTVQGSLSLQKYIYLCNCSNSCLSVFAIK